MRADITRTSHVNGTITFAKEEKEAIKLVYLVATRIKKLMNELDNHRDNFEAYLNYGKSTEEFFTFEEIFDALENLKDLESVEYEYDEP